MRDSSQPLCDVRYGCGQPAARLEQQPTDIVLLGWLHTDESQRALQRQLNEFLRLTHYVRVRPVFEQDRRGSQPLAALSK